MATTTAVAPESQPSIGAMGRVVGALFSPKPTFEDIARRPSWWAPILILSILGCGVGYFMNQKIDWASYIRTQNEKKSSFAQQSEEQKTAQSEIGAKFSRALVYGFGVAGPAFFTLIFALIYMGAFNVFASAGVRFNQAFGIMAHAAMPTAVASVLIMITLALKPYGQATPETMLASHPGMFLSSDAPRWLMSLLSSFELFWIWEMILIGLGFAVVNPKKVPLGKGIGIVVGLWLVWIVLKVGGTYLLS